MGSVVTHSDVGAEESVAKPAAGPDQVKLALDRTFLAHERTMMAWNRTAASMITFGFTLYKFFNFLHEEKPATQGEQIFGARTYGMCFIAIGVFTLVVATWQHRQQLKALRTLYPEAPMSLSLVLAALMGTLGAIAFTVGIFRL
jgi:putative membrane protein